MGSVTGRTHVHRETSSVEPEFSCSVQVLLNWATAPKSCFRRGPDVTVQDTTSFQGNRRANLSEGSKANQIA